MAAESELLIVLAHGWLNCMTALSGAASTLCEFGDGLSAEDRDRLLDIMIRQSAFLEAEWQNLI